MRWFADDSDLKMIEDHNFPNVILFGGFAISYEEERALKADIEAAKGRFVHPRSPIKWNFKDLRGKYRQQNHEEAYRALLENMFEVRKAIFEAASKHNFCIIFSLVRGYSSDKQVLREAKSDLARYVFTNSLMRFALHAQECKANKPEIILDWPDGNDPKPYDIEYASAYNFGKTKDGVSYHSGPLSELGFSDSPAYCRMPHNTMLQFADMVLGATREFVCHSIDESKTGQGIELLGTIANKFRGYPNNVVGRGISVNGRADDIKRSITTKFQELYVDL